MAAPVIAVIEDDPAILQMMDLLLRDAGYQVISYSVGKDAHQFVLRTMPDLVILDLRLEHADAGSMVLGLLELDPATRHIPVIICSAHFATLRDLAVSLQDKGHRIVAKPFKVEHLLSQIQAALNGSAGVKRSGGAASPSRW